MQFERAKRDYSELSEVKEGEWANKVKEMQYTSNDGALVNFTMTWKEFQGLRFKEYFDRMYKKYYASYFGDRAKAKLLNEELGEKKIKGGDVVIVDGIGGNTSKILGYFEKSKGMGYTTSVVWLDIDAEYSVARDQYRGETEGRSVGMDAILGYVPLVKKSWAVYRSSDLVDRCLHFKWHGGIIEGEYVLIDELKRYPRRM
jgi:hypothetical protein